VLINGYYICGYCDYSIGGYWWLSYILKQQWCLSVWAVPGRFFQSLPIPCGAGDKQGRAR